jgi:hypothetical protein
MGLISSVVPSDDYVTNVREHIALAVKYVYYDAL